MSFWACCVSKFSYKSLCQASSFIGTLLEFCGMTRDLVFGVLAGFSSEFGELAFIFRISNFGIDFRSFLALFSFDFPSQELDQY